MGTYRIKLTLAYLLVGRVPVGWVLWRFGHVIYQFLECLLLTDEFNQLRIVRAAKTHGRFLLEQQVFNLAAFFLTKKCVDLAVGDSHLDSAFMSSGRLTSHALGTSS